MTTAENQQLIALEQFLDDTLDLGLGTFQRKLEAFAEASGGLIAEALQPGSAQYMQRSLILCRWCSQARYHAARVRQLEDGHFAFWVYRSGSCSAHQDLNGLALPPSHPFWLSHTPANGLWCNCYVVGTNTRAGIKRLGGDPDKTLPSGWQEVLPETGLPQGIEPGFDEASHPDAVACLVALCSGKYDLSPEG